MNNPNPVATTPGTSTPAAGASPSSGASNEGGSEESTFDFAGLAEHDEFATPEPVSGTEGTAASAPAPAAPDSSASAASPSTPATPGLPAPPAAAAPPLPTTEQQPVQPPAVATEPPAATGQPELSLEQHRSKYVPEIAKQYALTEAEVEGIRVNPGETFPQLAANLHYNVQQATYHGILSVIPQMIAHAMKSQEAATASEQKFFGQWPALQTAVASNPQAKGVVEQAIRLYQQMNPKATLEDTIARAGLAAMMNLGLPLNLPGAAPAAAQPVAPVVPQAPARPPGIGATGHVQPNGAQGAQGDESNIFAELVEGHERGLY